MTEFVRAAVHEGAVTLPGPAYTSEDIFRQEVEKIFYRGWFCVGRAEQIPDPGDYFVAGVVDENIIVVRDREGRIHAFYNVCRHRGAQICQETRGRFSETIMCPYHAWTYNLQGKLVAARHMAELPDFDKSNYPLYSVAVAEWEGFLFVNLAREPEPFERYFAPLIDKFGAWRMPELRAGHRVEYDVKANWKLLVENYSECYHCPLIHPALNQLSHYQSGRNDLSEGPFLGGYMDLNHDAGSMTMDGSTSRPPIQGVTPEDLNHVYYYSIFPNMLLSLHPDYVMAHVLWPLGAGRTRVVCEWYFEPETMALPDFDPMDAVEFWDMTNRQDWHACEISQIGLSSRAYTPGPYSHSEGLLWAFTREYRHWMQPEPSVQPNGSGNGHSNGHQ